MKRERGYMDAEDILFFIVFFGIIGGLFMLLMSCLLSIDSPEMHFVMGEEG